MFDSLEDILAAYKVSEYVSDGNNTIGFRDIDGKTSIYFRLVKGVYYFDGRLPIEWLGRQENFKHTNDFLTKERK